MTVEKCQPPAETHNSRFREMAQPLLKKLTGIIDLYFPNLHPDLITLTGLAGVFTGTAITTNAQIHRYEQKKRVNITALAILTAAQLTDSLDGAVARHQAKKSGVETAVKFPHGEFIDSMSDTFQELFMGVARIIMANRRNDRLGALTALTATVTNQLPRTARSFAEKQGCVCPENGHNLWGFCGTRFGRAILATLGTTFPEIRKLPIQAFGDILTTTANLVTFLDRLQIANQAQKSGLSDQAVNKARQRFKLNAGLTALVISIAALAYIKSARKNNG